MSNNRDLENRISSLEEQARKDRYSGVSVPEKPILETIGGVPGFIVLVVPILLISFFGLRSGLLSYAFWFIVAWLFIFLVIGIPIIYSIKDSKK